MNTLKTIAIVTLLTGFAFESRSAVTLVENQQARTAIFVSPEVMAENRVPRASDTPAIQDAEKDRQRLRESVRDLSRCLEKISGARVEIVPSAPLPGEKRLPILIGDLAEKTFGSPAKKAIYRQGFRVVIAPKGIGLVGESPLATSYAIYEVLDRLGCRWYMPGELGEVIPELKSIVLEEMDLSSAPGTIYRGIWYADDAYKRRNRLGGLLLQAGHALEFYITKEERKAHPEWKAIISGKTNEVRLKWSSQGVADAIADRILARQKQKPVISYSLSPDDGMHFDESPEGRALDAGDWDEVFGQVSITDRLLVLCNRIISKVDRQYPDLLYGMLAYSQYVRPPVREKVPPNLVPQLAPITYARAHPMTDDCVPANKTLRDAVEGWGKAAKMVSYYFYGWFLAETTAPNPMITKWSVDLPIIYRNNCRFWQPETIPNFETSMHGLYLGIRMAWNPEQQPADIVREINTRFYGAAAAQMTAYWNYIDDAWVKTPEYSGCGFAYRRRFTPEVMKKARLMMDEALGACKAPVDKQRVEMANESLKLFEQFMKLREDLSAGRFADLESDANRWLDGQKSMYEKYRDNYAFGAHFASPLTLASRYFNPFYGVTYRDASRIAKEFQILTTPPIGPFRFQVDKEKNGEALGWSKPDFDDRAWKTADPMTDSLSALGYHDYFGAMWYRASFKSLSIPAGKKVFLWLGATDGSAKVFVNGKPIAYVNPKGETKDRAEGFCQPFSWDVTDAIRPGVDNELSILCIRTEFNELGTGGLIGPVVLYREK